MILDYPYAYLTYELCIYEEVAALAKRVLKRKSVSWEGFNYISNRKGLVVFTNMPLPPNIPRGCLMFVVQLKPMDNSSA